MYLFRADVNPNGNINPKGPNNTTYTWADCVLYGNRKTRFIPTTDYIAIASERYANHEPRNGELQCSPKSRVIMIDTRRLNANNNLIVPAMQNIPTGDSKMSSAKKLATANRMVLVEGSIPASAYVVVPPMLVDVLSCVQIKLEDINQNIMNDEHRLDTGIDEEIEDSKYKINRLREEKKRNESDLDELRKSRDESIKLGNGDFDEITQLEIKLKDKEIKKIAEKIKKEKTTIKRLKKYKKILPDIIAKERAKRDRLAHSLDILQDYIMTGQGEDLISDYVTNSEFNDIEKAFIDLYYGTDASMGEVASIFDKAISCKETSVGYDDKEYFFRGDVSKEFHELVQKEGKVDGLDLANAVRQGIIRKIVDSEEFREGIDLDDNIRLGVGYRTIPYGHLVLSSEKDSRDRSNKNTIPAEHYYYDYRIYVSNGTKFAEGYTIEDENDEETKVMLSLMLKAFDKETGGNVRSIPVEGLIDVDKVRLKELIEKRGNETEKQEDKKKKIRKKATGSTKKVSRSSKVVKAAAALDGQKKTKKEAASVDDTADDGKR